MACGGLKTADKKIDISFLNKHHSVRVIDFAIEIQNYMKQIFLKNGNFMQIRVGIHTGIVVSVVVGDIKPQFSLIGKTVNKTCLISRVSPPMKLTVSQQTQHYLDLYTNNLLFSSHTEKTGHLKGEKIF